MSENIKLIYSEINYCISKRIIIYFLILQHYKFIYFCSIFNLSNKTLKIISLLFFQINEEDKRFNIFSNLKLSEPRNLPIMSKTSSFFLVSIQILSIILFSLFGKYQQSTEISSLYSSFLDVQIMLFIGILLLSYSLFFGNWFFLI